MLISQDINPVVNQNNVSSQTDFSPRTEQDERIQSATINNLHQANQLPTPPPVQMTQQTINKIKQSLFLQL